MIKNNKLLEILDLRLKQSYNMDGLDLLLQTLFNLPKFKKFSLTFYCGYPMNRSAMLSFCKRLGLESTLGISRIEAALEKRESLDIEYNTNEAYQFKIVYEKH